MAGDKTRQLTLDVSNLPSVSSDPRSPVFYSVSNLPSPVVGSNGVSDTVPESPRQDNVAVKGLGVQGVVRKQQQQQQQPTVQKRFFSTPLPKDSQLISQVLNEKANLPGGQSGLGNVPVTRHRRQSSSLSSIVAENMIHNSFTGYTNADGKIRSWQYVKLLGKGSFSTVVLGRNEDMEDINYPLVAIKITDLTAMHTNNVLRIKASLMRELDILGKCHHPCIINVVGSSTSDKGDNVVTFLDFCEGGDLFELASKHRSQIKPELLRRIFAELTSAVQYLHNNYVVHRDIKLENVLIDIETSALLHSEHMSEFESPIVKLTDFGLSKKLDPENVLSEVRCGSEDYVAPELLMGQKYDGRQTDTWALGVLLYALMEGRLPFDAPPPTINPITGKVRSSRVRSRPAHRIARIEWNWYFFKNENATGIQSPDQYHYSAEFWNGAKEIVENTLVKRDKRWTSQSVLETGWCQDGLPFFLRGS